MEDSVHTAAYGPGGEPHTSSTDGRRVTIVELRGQPQPEALKALLLGHLTATGERADGAESLPSLLARCERSLSA